MKVVIRTDASFEIGTGHVMRCLTLAEQLRDQGASVLFVCRELPGHMCDWIENRGYTVCRLKSGLTRPDGVTDTENYAGWLGASLEEDAAEAIDILKANQNFPDWLVVDHYAIDARWETELRPYVDGILVIDDLANRRHDTDILLDQNIYEDMHTRYQPLVSGHCRLLLGPEYALLRREFIDARQEFPERTGIVKRILIFFGGVDATNETTKALQAIRQIQRSDVAVDVVIGRSNQHRGRIQIMSRNMPNVTLHHQIDNMARLMLASDLAIGGGGTTTWERCCLGLPTITIVVARNQREMIAAVADRGAVWNLDWYAEVTVDTVKSKVQWVLNHPEAVRTMSQKAGQLMGDPGRYDENLVVTAMMETIHAVP